MSAPSGAEVTARIAAVARDFAARRAERQQRRHLEAADFAALAATGFPLLAVPEAEGGGFASARTSTRPIGEALRALARGDSSVALVAAMHPSVLSYWLTAPRELDADARWCAQCRHIWQSVRGGCWWGTITSEPGSAGDITKSRTVAARAGGDLDYTITGQKHFGSGSGITSFMVTTAVPEGEHEADWFFADVRAVPWDGSRGLRLIAPWDGHGMIATQSHGMAFERFPATRIAWPGHLLAVAANAGGAIGCWFTSVIAGICDEAVATARRWLDGKDLGAFEQTEWTRAQTDHWLIQRALEGMYRAVETQADPRRDVLHGKTAVAELAETMLTRICRVIGGSTLGRGSPFGFWAADVRALGFLRPPWALAFASLPQLPPE
jgi:alkylation response protein AidB-like acyl-CoA dehydrogenase